MMEISMATFRKRGKGWRAEVRKGGQYISATLPTKSAAQQWAAEKELDIANGKHKLLAGKLSVRDALEKYARTVSPTKQGARWEKLRLRAMGRDPLGDVLIRELKTLHVADFRDRRLLTVKSSTVNRELNLLSSVFKKAKKEWHWLHENPIRELDRPRQPRPRDRLISDDEILRLQMALSYFPRQSVQTKTELVGLFFLLAIETGMRLGELCSLEPPLLHLDHKFIQLERTKNGDQRQVPLSPLAIELCTSFLATPIRMTSASASTLFRKAVKNAEIDNLHFHDTRHEAITRLSKKLDVLAIARMVGHRDIRSLMIYYNETATELALRL
jgi:integrase